MMTAITIKLSDDRLQRLKELAAASGVSPEELVRQSVDVWLQQPKNDFAEAAAYVLRKNADLYNRLAK